MIKVGNLVGKLTGDYYFYGIVVGVINKLNGTIRYCVENEEGLLFIFNATQLLDFGATSSDLKNHFITRKQDKKKEILATHRLLPGSQ